MISHEFVQRNIANCQTEIEHIEQIIAVLGTSNPAVNYLTKYTLIKICGIFEQSFKTIISDAVCCTNNERTRLYVDTTFRESSINPSLDNIKGSLNKFDREWKNKFKEKFNAVSSPDMIKDHINSLNNLRNRFAHGSNPSVSFQDLKDYFASVKYILKILDETCV
ncbi:HEPN domain-containing protein [Actinobacillus equuli]|uniref:HEPN domain-containing protein n=1 Tax=Actinobacillus equuli TaxID=718 RepID=UPI0024418B46|nr:HEPN domain-containing protein [Actinobacillus equuli]WGE59493.1 HEPN domain-containing protein [Actinobacillus equuli subsp. haemolyticus]WGE61866.1 HEPN domain-containing protein [Actinobacillus equuli subsp. haemolyticus]